MGLLSFSVSGYGIGSGGTGTVQSSAYVTGGAYTTTTSASNVEDASGDISLNVGHLISLYADEAMRVRFGGTAATASTGHFLPAETPVQFEVAPGDDGTVSVIDVA